MSYKYVYESPDGGKTITRRVIDGNGSRELQVDSAYYPLKELYEMQRKLNSEAACREKYPAVKEAWDNYQTLLQLAKGDKDGQD